MTHKRSVHHELLLQALISPECLVDYSAADWDLLIRLARRVRLLGRLAVALKDKNLLEKIPERAANQLLTRNDLSVNFKGRNVSYWSWKKKMPASSREKYCTRDANKLFVCTGKG